MGKDASCLFSKPSRIRLPSPQRISFTVFSRIDKPCGTFFVYASECSRKDSLKGRMLGTGMFWLNISYYVKSCRSWMRIVLERRDLLIESGTSSLANAILPSM